jgi:CHAD domain-containing protein
VSDEPFGDRMFRVVRERLRTVLDDAPGALERGRDAEVHALRIAIKRLRYNLEFTAGLAPGPSGGAMRLLALMQERLGAHADAAAFARTYGALLDALPADDERRPGLESLLAAARRDKERALARARALWDGAGAEPYRERLVASISGVLGSLSPNDAE